MRAIHDHAEAGDVARTVAIFFFVALAAWVLIPWYLDRRRAGQESDGSAPTGRGSRILRTALMITTAVLATASMVTVYQAGHSGATSVWHDQTVSEPSNGG